MQQVAGYHVHIHLAIYVNGQQRRLPAGAGIAGPVLDEHMSQGLFVDNGVTGCLYWLHVHADDGIIHVEAPTQATFTLGQFFDIWQQPLGPDQVGPAKGPVVAFVNGKQVSGNPRDIPLVSQDDIQFDLGAPVIVFQPLTFKVNGLCGSTVSSCAAPPGADHSAVRAGGRLGTATTGRQGRWWDSNPRPDDYKGAKGRRRPGSGVAPGRIPAGQNGCRSGRLEPPAILGDGPGPECWDGCWDGGSFRRRSRTGGRHIVGHSCGTLTPRYPLSAGRPRPLL